MCLYIENEDNRLNEIASKEFRKNLFFFDVREKNWDTKLRKLLSLPLSALENKWKQKNLDVMFNRSPKAVQLLKIMKMKDSKEKQQAIQSWKQKNDDIRWRQIFNKEAQEMYGKPFQDLEDWQRDEVYAKRNFGNAFQMTENQPEREPARGIGRHAGV